MSSTEPGLGLQPVFFWRPAAAAAAAAAAAGDEPLPWPQAGGSVGASVGTELADLAASLTTSALLESVELACARGRLADARAGAGAGAGAGGCAASALGCAALTDGVHVWPESAAHYVLAHGVAPPAAFAAHVRATVAAWRARGRGALPRLAGLSLQPAAARGGQPCLEPAPRGWLALLRAAGSVLAPPDGPGGMLPATALSDAREWLACSQAARQFN